MASAPSASAPSGASAAAAAGDPDRMDLFVLKSLERVRAQAGFFERDIKDAIDATSSEQQRQAVLWSQLTHVTAAAAVARARCRAALLTPPAGQSLLLELSVLTVHAFPCCDSPPAIPALVSADRRPTPCPSPLAPCPRPPANPAPAEAINEAIVAQRGGQHRDAGSGAGGAGLGEVADRYFQPFAMALEPRRSAKMKVAALDATEKMIGASCFMPCRAVPCRVVCAVHCVPPLPAAPRR